ncbi:hypothetical protein [Flavisphingomonas formosensis]|uniref:hypothetical protein n=1 Tax=Flavisphingomonas formosensis TaxID=861534 RepID=UPI001E29A911|nr:hypothetical protein [Sphingomonas formosensis]
MSETTPPWEKRTEKQVKQEQAAEAAAIRRRWINLGEVLAVVAVMISGLTLWNSYQERANSEADRAKSEQKADAQSGTLVLRATIAKEGRRLSLAAMAGDQAIQSQTISFPSALGVSPVDTAGDPRIESGWFESELHKARKEAGLDEKSTGDARLPILVKTQFLSNGELKNDSAIYDLGYRISSGFLSGTDVRMRGLSLIRRGVTGDGQKQIDAIWDKQAKTK